MDSGENTDAYQKLITNIYIKAFTVPTRITSFKGNNGKLEIEVTYLLSEISLL